ncbi:MAG: transposase [Bradyrhizobium sp.]|jgi:transposase|nr:transposase [Bradyrhizobium sp.]
MDVGAVKAPTIRRSYPCKPLRQIGLDIAKSVFQVPGVDTAGRVIIRRQLRLRAALAFFQKLPPCLIGIEACASSHHWSRELQALGHSVRLMPPAYVKPDVKRQKNDMADALTICEALSRANMRFVPTKTPEQQSCLMLHRTQHLLIRQQTAVMSHRSGAKALWNCSMLLPTRATNGCLRPAGRRWSWWGRVIFYVANVDELYDRALTAGCQPTTAPRDAE